MKKTNGKKNQRGVALLFSLGMLGMMMVLALTFASVSMTDAEIGENETAKVSARALARTAVNRALFQLKNSQTLQSTGTSGSNVYLTGNLRTDEIVSGNNTALIASGVDNNNQRDFDYLWKAVPDRAFTSTERIQLSAGMDTGYHTDFMNAMRYRLLCKYGQTPGLEKYFDPAKDTKDNTSYLVTQTDSGVPTVQTKYRAVDANLRTTPFWEYVRNPATNAIIGRFAYLAYRPHGLLDWTAYADTSANYTFRLGLFPSEITLDSLVDDTFSADHPVYGRWVNLTQNLQFNGRSNMKSFHTGSDMFRYLFGINNTSASAINIKTTALSPSNGTQDKLLAEYPNNETAFNNLLGKWLRVTPKYDAQSFWYQINSGTPKRYLRFNLNRDKDAWDSLTVFDLVDTNNLKEYLYSEQEPNADGTGFKNTSIIQANATKCIPWFINSSNIPAQNQLASNFLSWFSTPIHPSVVANRDPDELKFCSWNIRKRGFWGKTGKSSSDACEGSNSVKTKADLKNELSASSFAKLDADKELLICDDPDWTANMRTPYIKEVVLKLKLSFSIENNADASCSYTDGSGTHTVYYYNYAGITGRLMITPYLYVTTVDFFARGATDNFSNVKFRLKGTQGTNARIQLSFPSLTGTGVTASSSPFKIRFNGESGSGTSFIPVWPEKEALEQLLHPDDRTGTMYKLRYSPHYGTPTVACPDPSDTTVSAALRQEVFYACSPKTSAPFAVVSGTKTVPYSFIDAEGNTKNVTRLLPYKLKTYEIPLSVKDDYTTIPFTIPSEILPKYEVSNKENYDNAKRQSKIEILYDPDSTDQITASVQDLSIGLYSQDGVPLDFAKLRGSTAFSMPLNTTFTSPMLYKGNDGADSNDNLSASYAAYNFYADFRAKDVRSNLNETDWDLQDQTTTIASQGGDTAFFTAMSSADSFYGSHGSGGTTDDSASEDFSGPTLASYIRPPLPSAHNTSGYNYPIPHPWEIGLISRGDPFQTINLKQFNPANVGNSANTLFYGTGGFGTYAAGDANILDQVMVARGDAKSSSDTLDIRDQLGRVDVNAISFLNDPDPALFASTTDHYQRYQYPNRGNLFAARILFTNGLIRNLEPFGDNTSSFFLSTDDGQGVLSDISKGNTQRTAREWYLDGPPVPIAPATYTQTESDYRNERLVSEATIKNLLEGIAAYNKRLTDMYSDPTMASSWANICDTVRKNMFHSRAELLKNTVDLSLLNANDRSRYQNDLDTALNQIRRTLIGSTSLTSDTFPANFSDCAKEELFSKLVMLLEAGDGTTAQPDRDLIVLGIAQSIRDSSRTAVPLDLTGDGTYATPSLAANDARVKNGSAYKNFAGIFYDFSDFHSSSTYPSVFSAFGSKSQFSSGMVLGGSAGLTGMNNTGLGYYQPGFDKILSTQKILGWFRKDDSGKWKIIRTDYVE